MFERFVNTFDESNKNVRIDFCDEQYTADLLIDNTVIEFANKNLSSEEFFAKNLFFNTAGYRVVWVVDISEQLKGNKDERQIKKIDNLHTWDYCCDFLCFAPLPQYNSANISICVYNDNDKNTKVYRVMGSITNEDRSLYKNNMREGLIGDAEGNADYRFFYIDPTCAIDFNKELNTDQFFQASESWLNNYESIKYKKRKERECYKNYLDRQFKEDIRAKEWAINEEKNRKIKEEKKKAKEQKYLQFLNEILIKSSQSFIRIEGKSEEKPKEVVKEIKKRKKLRRVDCKDKDRFDLHLFLLPTIKKIEEKRGEVICITQKQ